MNYYVDLNAQILPGFAASPLNKEQAENRTETLRESNIKQAVAAPFYGFGAAEPDYTTFLAARDAAAAAINEQGGSMRVVTGAVLSLTGCMEHPRELKPAAIGDTNYLLVYLPKEPVTESLCDELSRLHIVSGLCPILADADRYYDIWSPEDFLTLRENGLLFQISAEGVLDSAHRKLSLFLLANHYAQFVASGAVHTEEPPHFTEAMRVIQRSLPAQSYRRIKNNAGKRKAPR